MEVQRRPVIREPLSFQGGKLLAHVGKKTLASRDELEMITQYLHGKVITLDGIPVENACQYWKAQAALWGLIDHTEKAPNRSLYYYKDMFWRALATLRDPPADHPLHDLFKLEREMKAEYYGTPPPTIVPAESVTIKQEPLEIDSLESTLDVLAISSIEQKHNGADLSSLSAQKSPHESQSSTSSRAGPSAAGSAASLPDKQKSSSTKHILPGSKRPSVSTEQPSLPSKQPLSPSKQPLSPSKQPLSPSKQPLSSSKRSLESSKQPPSSIERPSSSSKQSSSSEQRSSVSKTPLSSTQTHASTSSTHMPPPPTKAKQQKSARQQTIRIVIPSPEPSLLLGGGELDHKTPIPHGTAKTAGPDIRCYSGTTSYSSGSSNSNPCSLVLSVHDGNDRAIGHLSTNLAFPIVFALHRLTYGEWSQICWAVVLPSNDRLSYAESGRLRVYQDGRVKLELNIGHRYKGIMIQDGEVSKDSLRLMKLHEEKLLKKTAKLTR